MDVIDAEPPSFLSVQMLSAAAVDDISIASSAAVISHTRSVGLGSALSSPIETWTDCCLLILLCLFFPSERAVVRAVCLGGPDELYEGAPTTFTLAHLLEAPCRVFRSRIQLTHETKFCVLLLVKHKSKE